MSEKAFRLVTRSDFDGIASAVLLRELGLIDEVKFAHPKDVQDGEVEITRTDITTNLPYSKNAHYAFDHHISEVTRVGEKSNYIVDPNSPSATRVVYNMFGGKEAFPNISEEFLDAVDKADSAKFTMDEVLNPKGWTLLSFLMDARTGLGRFHHFNISNYQLMYDLIDYCHKHKNVEEILRLPDVKERVELYFAHQDRYKEMLKRCTNVYGTVGVVDLLNEDVLYTGNRFVEYAIYPSVNVTVRVMWRVMGKRVVFACGKSIFNRTNKINVGELMLKYGGGGHKNSGTCQVDFENAINIKDEIISALNG
ncbi:MAG: hypothetical protein BWY78_00688 [Alphaproteobacteria bacterium ADurb.Bin438]|nr:MAG: hypothetical protein BWY78_00688 [Alphaproteobacteria bacterium ADurb.Bin438]